jgi:hypothetical protein
MPFLSRFVRSRTIAAALAVSIAACGFAAAQTPAATDYSRQPIPRAGPGPGRVSAQHAFLFGEPAYWPGSLHWRYNHTGAPPQLAANKSATIQQLIDAAAKWKAACGVDIVYDGETTAVPGAMVNGAPDRLSVIGWQQPAGGVMAATNAWTDSGIAGETLVDADIAISPTAVTTPQLLASIVAHEMGHAIGLGHSATADALMAGPPNAAYSNASELQPDDVQGCRCLYGPPAGTQAGFICSLPTMIEFEPVAAGAVGAVRQVQVNNDGSAPLTIQMAGVSTNDFAITSNTCVAGMTLAPGATCTIGVRAQPANSGRRADEMRIDTSEGPYRFPLSVEALAAPAQEAAQPSTQSFEGPWWAAPAGVESGWGLTLDHQGDAIFTTWVTYDANGKAIWLTMTALRMAATTYAGTLYRTSGPSLADAAFDSSRVQRTEVGTGTLTFSDGSSGTFAYTVNGISQSKPITRLVFGPLPTCTFGAQNNLALATNYQGNWWSAGGAESGWGIYLAHQGDNLFAGWFTYDTDGTPMWLSATATKSGNGVYSGTVYRTTGPAYDSAPFDPQRVGRAPVGTMTLTFANGNSARFDYSVTIGGTAISQSKLLSRLVFRWPGTACQ